VKTYVASGCGGPDLPLTIQEAANFRFFYDCAGHSVFSRWEGKGAGDLQPNGGSDIPEIYFFTGHGRCQNSPTATSPDFIVVCGNFNKPNSVTIGKECRWGNGVGNLQFALSTPVAQWT